MKQQKERFSLESLGFFIDLLMIGLGVFGMVGGLSYSLYLPEQGIYGVYILIVAGILLYIGDRFKKAVFKYFIIIILMISAMVVFLYSAETTSLLSQLMTVVENDYFLRFEELFINTHSQDTLLPIVWMIFLGFPITYYVVKIVSKKKQKLFPFVVFIIVFIFPVLIRHQLDTYTSYCFMLFMAYEYIFSYTLQKQKNPIRLKLIVLPLLAFFLFLSNLFLEPNPIFDQSTSTVLSQITSWINGDVLDGLFNGSNVTGTSSSISGDLPTSDVSMSHSKALTVKATQPFSSYIRGYSLARYENNQWEPVNNEFKKNHNSLSLITQHFSELGIATARQNVTVTSVKKTSYQFVPYFPNLNKPLINDSYYEPIDRSVSIYQVYPLISHAMYNIGSVYQRSEYDQYVKQEYLEIPSDLKERLTQFLKDNQDDVDLFANGSSALSDPYKADVIQKILTSHATYDLKAGVLPNDKDFVEYFMFENKKGSCTHFSTTLALLLRCVGIPTRFTRGYILKATDFVDGEATVLSNRSHAWVEAYFEGYGWVPYEATPVSGSTATPTEVGTMLDDQLEEDTNPSPNETQEQPTDQPDSNDQDTNDSNSTAPTNITHWYDAIVDYSYYIISVLGMFLVLWSYRFVTKRLFYFKADRLRSNQKVIYYYRRMKRLLRFGGKIDDEIVHIAQKAKFSQHILTDEEVKYVTDYYLIFIADIYEHLSWYRKFPYKYVFGYI